MYPRTWIPIKYYNHTSRMQLSKCKNTFHTSFWGDVSKAQRLSNYILTRPIFQPKNIVIKYKNNISYVMHTKLEKCKHFLAKKTIFKAISAHKIVSLSKKHTTAHISLVGAFHNLEQWHLTPTQIFIVALHSCKDFEEVLGRFWLLKNHLSQPFQLLTKQPNFGVQTCKWK